VGEIQVKVTPRSSRNAVELRDGAVKVWLMASPTNGQANAALCELLAKRLSVPKSEVCVTRGEASRLKTVAVAALSREVILQRLS